jgi:hypothetical protein
MYTYGTSMVKISDRCEYGSNNARGGWGQSSVQITADHPHSDQRPSRPARVSIESHPILSEVVTDLSKERKCFCLALCPIHRGGSASLTPRSWGFMLGGGTWR